jgi:hypothetical protein
LDLGLVGIAGEGGRSHWKGAHGHRRPDGSAGRLN